MEWFDSLFCEVGRKIKAVAKWTFIVTCVLMVIAGVLAMVGSLFSEETLPFVLVIPIGVFVTLFSLLFSSWLVYGFGTLIEKAEIDLRKEEQPAKQVTYPTGGSRKCTMCGGLMSANDCYCTNCGNVARATSANTVPISDGWKCACGNVNAKVYATCTACGMSAREVREQNQNKRKREIRQAAEDRIVAAGVCPDCNGTLEKSDISGVMTCPDCGRMFG